MRSVCKPQSKVSGVQFPYTLYNEGSSAGSIMPQLTFHEVVALSFLDNLSILQHKIVILVREQIPQAEIARKLRISRSRVNQIVKLFSDRNLIKPLQTTHKTEGKRHYNQFFEVSTALQKKLSQDTSPPISPIRTHHIIRKFSIIRQSRELSQDKRTGYNKSWQPHKGDYRHKYWYPGKAGEVSITIDVHPHTLVAYIDAGQKIIAETAVQAEDRGIQMVRDCVKNFVETQQLFGTRIEIDEIGQQVGKTHFGLAFHKTAPFATGQTTLRDTWIDSSVKSEVEPDKLEWETVNPVLATEMEIGMSKIATIDRHIQAGVTAALPEAMQEFNKQFGDLTSEVHQVMAYVQSGQSFQNQLNQLTLLVAQLIKQNHELQDELKKRG